MQFGPRRALQTRVASTAQAAGKRNAAKQKAKGIGLFKKCTCSADLAAITGSKSMTRGQAVKAVWASARFPLSSPLGRVVVLE